MRPSDNAPAGVPPVCITAADAYDKYRVTRAWLRTNAEAGNIRRTGLHCISRATGQPCVRYLYNVQDIERELRAWASRSQAHRTENDHR